MNKFVRLLLVAVVALGFVGCRTPGGEWNLPINGKAKIVDGYIGYSTREGGRQEIYTVVLEYRGRETNVRVSEEVFLKTKDGQEIDIRLLAVVHTPENRSVVCAHYEWKVLGNYYQIDFQYPPEEK